MGNQKMIRLAYGGMFAAAIAVATMFFKLPIVVGYIHLGDGLIFLSAAVLGPFASFAAAVGSALADVAAGYPIYAPVTFFIKGGMALLASWGFRQRLGSWQMLFLYTLCEGMMVGGYFLFDGIVYGWGTAAVAMFPNIIQGVAGVISGYVLVNFCKNRLLSKSN